MATMPANTVPSCSPFSCHVDCATSCAADDQPFDSRGKYDHPPAFDDAEDDGVECIQHEEKGIESSTHGPVSPLCVCVCVCVSVRVS